MTGNVTSGTDAADVYANVAPYSTEGVTFSPTIQNNTFSSDGDNVFVAADFSSHSGNVSISPTISNNSLTAGETNINFSTVSVSSGTGNVTVEPRVTDNSTMNAGTDYNFYLYQSCSYIDGNVSASPTITGNTMTGAGQNAVSISLYSLSVSSSSQEITVSPTISGNAIDHPGGEGVSLYLYYLEYGRFVSDLTISNNTFTNGDSSAIEITVTELSEAAGIDATWTVANNTITAPGGDGIQMTLRYMDMSADSGTFDLTIAGNTITDATGDGIYVSINSWESDAHIDQKILLQGNTITGSGGDGISLSLNGQTGLASNDLRIVDNVLQGNGEDGLYLTSTEYGTSPFMLVSCNTITGNTDNGINQYGGTDTYYDPPADYGGGALNSPGGNSVFNNGDGTTFFDFYNEDDDPVSARSNWWGTTNTATIAANIYDNADDGSKGAVDTGNFLGAAPTVVVAADLVDAVFADVAPPGASLGDTILYTATIAPAPGSCGDLGLTFTVPVPANATLVADSVTTSKGAVTGTAPVTVSIGPVTAGETITITWQVVADSGTQLSSQGTVTATRSGTALSNDPDTAAAADPTVTLFDQQQGAEPIPTLGQWGLLLFGTTLLLLGLALLRRRRFAAASLAVALALGAGWAGAAPPSHGDGRQVIQKTLAASTISTVAASETTVALTLADGTGVTVPRRALKVHDLRGRRERPQLEGLDHADRLIARTTLQTQRKAARAQQQAEREAMNTEQRSQLRDQLRVERRQEKLAKAATRRDPLALLAQGTPVVLQVVRGKGGAILTAQVHVYASEERARAEAERALVRRETKRPRE